MCLLRELYGAGVEKLRIEHQSIVVSTIIMLNPCGHNQWLKLEICHFSAVCDLSLINITPYRLHPKKRLKLTQLPVTTIWRWIQGKLRHPRGAIILTESPFSWFLTHWCVWFWSDAGNSDRVVIQELIKTVAQSQQIQSSTQREFKGQYRFSICIFNFN